MFDCEFAGADDAAVAAAIEDGARLEAAAGARRLAAIAELARRRVLDDDERATWACDMWDSAAAEVGAAMNISHRRASGQMRIAETLRDHLPAVAELFRRGRLSTRVVSTITWRTRLVTDDAVWARLDAAVAERAETWGPLPEKTLIAAVDALVLQFDKAALIARREVARTRDFTIGYRDDEAGLTAVWGTLLAPDAAVLNKKVAAMAATVCADDPRSLDDAAPTPWARWPTVMSTCRARANHPTARPGKRSRRRSPRSWSMSSPTTPPPPPPPTVGTAILAGTEAIPTPLLAQLLRNGARLRPLCPPSAEHEPGYRPSAKLARHIRNRDLTCRFPGCTMPAEFCDIDHVIPYPIGPTHPSNLTCLCRKHHHLKTFWTGDWDLKLLPDGAAEWTSPTGRTYTTHPGCRSYFPEWDTDTGNSHPHRHREPGTYSTPTGA